MSESADQARTRRRWISLAEFVAVAGLLIGAATLYLNWADRREDQAKVATETAAEGKARQIVTLTGTAEDDTIALADAQHTISDATVRFPSTLRVAAQDAMPGPAIHADWFGPALLKLTDHGPDERTGRLPVLITVGWWDGEAKRQDTALYDVLWRTKGRLIGGRKLELTGLALKSRTRSPAALEAAWKREAPAAK